MTPSRREQAIGPKEAFRNLTLLPVIITFLVLSYAAVGLRLWTRGCLRKILGWDDFCIVLSQILFTVYCGSLLAIYDLAGYAADLYSVEHLYDLVNLILVAECFYIVTVIFIKLSLGIFFMRVCVDKRHKAFTAGVLTLSTVFGAAFLLFAIFQCGVYPGPKVFTQRMLGLQCASRRVSLAMNYTHAIITTVTDWMCGVLPLFIINQLRIPFRAKVIVVLLLVLAAIGSIASIVRVLYVSSITVPTGKFFISTSKLAVWSTVEPGIGIVVACLATLRPLFGKCLYHARNSIVRMSASHNSVRMSNPILISRFSRIWREDRSSSVPSTWGSRDSGGSTVFGEARNTAAKLDDMVHTQDFASPRAKTRSALAVPVRALTIPEMNFTGRLVDFTNVDYGQASVDLEAGRLRPPDQEL